MRIGLRDDPGEEIWSFLQRRGEALIKAHYALWARWYEQTDGKPGQWAITSLHQFCADLGYSKHRNGGFRAEQKQEAASLLDVLTAVEVEATFSPAGKAAGSRRLDGPLWQRRAAPDTHPPSGAHLQPARGDARSCWDPEKFVFSPGRWFADPVWRKQNPYVGQISVGLLRLSQHKDQVAIRIGAYLATLARIDQYRPTAIRIDTLLDRIGMAGSYPKEPAKLRDVLQASLSKLQKVGVIAGWEGLDDDPAEPDMDDYEHLSNFDDYAPSPWRRRVIEIRWPEELARHTPRLEQGRQKASRPRKRPREDRQ
jgi:hypothetical protein